MFIGMIGSDSPAIIENNSPAHAKVILQELMECAKETVHILCTHFSKEVYGDKALQTSIKDAIGRGVSVKIAVRDEKPQASDFYRELGDNFPNKCSLYAGIQATNGKTVFASDFCVVDSKRYRLERDQTKGTAFVCANAPDVAGRLVAWFDASVRIAA